MQEIWKDIPGFEGMYQASNTGRVKGLARRTVRAIPQHLPERILKQSEPGRKRRGQGYLQVTLFDAGRRKCALVHRLVAETFIPNPENKQTVNHKNGNKHDNAVENLEWATSAENNEHAVNTGLNKRLSKPVPVDQYDESMNLIAHFPSMHEAERQTGISNSNILNSVRKGHKAGGFIWKKAQ